MSTSPDEAGFLNAITENPADETARLAFADWLQEQGDSRAAFVRASAQFLSCVRELADRRRALPPEWLEVTDPLFNRFGVHYFAHDGSAVNEGTVLDVRIAPGSSIAQDQAAILIRRGPSVVEERAELAGLVTAVFVRQGETVSVGQPLFATFSGLEKFVLRTPRAPMLEFIQSLEKQRRALRQNPKELNEAMLARHATALEIVFGAKAVRGACEMALDDLGYRSSPPAAAGEHVQERIDIHIRALRVLLAQHGQPDGFTERPAPPDDSAPVTE